MHYSEEVKKLAETLRSSGLVASMEDALKRAQSMLGKDEARTEPEAGEEPFKEIDSAQTTLGVVNGDMGKEEANEPENDLEAEELKTEEVFKNKPDNEANIEKEPEGPSNKDADIRPRKIDLSDIFNVNK